MYIYKCLFSVNNIIPGAVVPLDALENGAAVLFSMSALTVYKILHHHTSFEISIYKVHS